MHYRNFMFTAFFTTPTLAADFVSETTKNIDGIVYNCNDGDTCHVGVAEAMWMNVRLAGIDAPEVAGKKKQGQEMGEKSRDFLNNLVKGKNVSIRQVDLDHYNRPVVELSFEGKLINIQILEQGHAEMYRGKTKRLDKTQYEAAEKVAKDAKRGIWSLSNYVSPKEFRNQKKR